MSLTSKTRATLAHLVALAVVVTLAVPPMPFSQVSVALADTVTATTVGGIGDQTKVPGATGTASFFLTPTNTPAGDPNGCDANGINNPATITVSSANPSV